MVPATGRPRLGIALVAGVKDESRAVDEVVKGIEPEGEQQLVGPAHGAGLGDQAHADGLIVGFEPESFDQRPEIIGLAAALAWEGTGREKGFDPPLEVSGEGAGDAVLDGGEAGLG